MLVYRSDKLKETKNGFDQRQVYLVFNFITSNIKTERFKLHAIQKKKKIIFL